MKKREHRFFIRVTEEERNCILDKMYGMGIHSLSAYIHNHVIFNSTALDAEFAELLTKKKAAYPDYRKARDEMQVLVRAQKNVERFFAEEKDTTEKTQTR